ncbi:MAG: GNAT family N-acetyltransferase [bacterium]|nr:GNAT family N-acetyltransferase [bacterium]
MSNSDQSLNVTGGVVRIANESDASQLMKLYRELNPDDPVIPLATFTEHLKSIVTSKNNIVFVLEVGGNLVSSCYLNVIPNLSRNLASYATLENVVTHEPFRRRSYGTTVVKYALDTAWARGCYKVMLQTGSKNQSKHLFYQKCGFKQGEKLGFIAKNDPGQAA